MTIFDELTEEVNRRASSPEGLLAVLKLVNESLEDEWDWDIALYEMGYTTLWEKMEELIFRYVTAKRGYNYWLEHQPDYSHNGYWKVRGEFERCIEMYRNGIRKIEHELGPTIATRWKREIGQKVSYCRFIDLQYRYPLPKDELMLNNAVSTRGTYFVRESCS